MSRASICADRSSACAICVPFGCSTNYLYRPSVRPSVDAFLSHKMYSVHFNCPFVTPRPRHCHLRSGWRTRARASKRIINRSQLHWPSYANGVRRRTACARTIYVYVGVFMLRIGAGSASHAVRAAESSCGTRSKLALTLEPYMITTVITAKPNELMFYAKRYAVAPATSQSTIAVASRALRTIT